MSVHIYGNKRRGPPSAVNLGEVLTHDPPRRGQPLRSGVSFLSIQEATKTKIRTHRVHHDTHQTIACKGKDTHWSGERVPKGPLAQASGQEKTTNRARFPEALRRRTLLQHPGKVRLQERIGPREVRKKRKQGGGAGGVEGVEGVTVSCALRGSRSQLVLKGDYLLPMVPPCSKNTKQSQKKSLRCLQTRNPRGNSQSRSSASGVPSSHDALFHLHLLSLTSHGSLHWRRRWLFRLQAKRKEGARESAGRRHTSSAQGCAGGPHAPSFPDPTCCIGTSIVDQGSDGGKIEGGEGSERRGR